MASSNTGSYFSLLLLQFRSQTEAECVMYRVYNVHLLWFGCFAAVPIKGQNESFSYFSICSCSNIVNYELDNFAEFEKQNRAVNDSN